MLSLNKLKKYLNNSVESFLNPEVFPNFSDNPIKLHLLLAFVKKRVKTTLQKNNLSDIVVNTNPIALSVWSQLSKYNLNNIGNWSYGMSRNINTLFEKKVIKMMINLYQGSPNLLEGYVTTGATESNIFSCWLGRNYLRSRTNNICIIVNPLVHYSIIKAAELLNINCYATSINREEWNIKLLLLKKAIISQYKKNVRGFIIPITLGYSLTGTNDDYVAIDKLIQKLKMTYKDIHFFMWIDAALSGLTIPFIEKDFRPFRCQNIYSIAVDFHKLAGVPYPAGIILYSKKLRKFIEKKINYLPIKDNTLLGSRSGISAIAIWFTIQHYGKAGFKKLITGCLNQKQQFIDTIKRSFPDIKIVSSPDSLQLLLISKRALPVNFINQYQLYPISRLHFDTKNITDKLYKLFFLPKF